MVDRTLRPAVPLAYPDEAEHRRQIAVRTNASLPKDGTEGMTNPLKLKSVTVAELTGDLAASLWTGSVVYVSDGAVGEKFRGSNGSAWVNLG